jgi:cobalt/nickel transport system permease protein
MHVPDGFLSAPTSIATGAVAAAGIALALKRARYEMDEQQAPLAGLAAAFVFAAQMINFPVGAGTSGHFVGGALAAVLVGPWTAILVMSVVILLQSLLFADGGLTALGTNISLLGLAAVASGWLITKAVLAVLPRRQASVVPAAVVGAALSVPLAALVFVLLFAAGGAADLPFGTLLTSMVGVHVLIGIGEAAITGLTLSAVLAVRPDLVYAARGLKAPLVLKTADGAVLARAAEQSHRARVSLRALLIGGGVVTTIVAGTVSFLASSAPDGLESVAGTEGFADAARNHAFGGSALADYGEVGGIPVGLAGLLGAAVVLVIGLVLFAMVRQRGDAPDRAKAPSS